MFKTIELFGNTINLYDFFNNAATVFQVILLALTIKDYKLASTFPIICDRHLNLKKKTERFPSYIFCFIEAVIIMAVNVVISQKTSAPVSQLFLGKGDVNFFPNILISPLCLFAFGVLLMVSPLKILDYSAPIMVIGLISFKIACYCCGCCYGIEYGTHFYNYKNERFEVPVQLIELACAIIMFIILLVMRKKKKKAGYMYPAFMLMYCGSRFCSEFLRDDYPPVIWRMTGYHIQCIVGFVLGLIYLIIVIKYGEKITGFFEGKNKAFLDKVTAAYDKKHNVPYPKKKK